ncbi:hypothetical protein BCR44DRAFT_1452696 [Catenaria anguillulae PL171]|uniref:Uncharacterized protein n=1 Tax=Catenaria anguillulae PL171 TaxID=765915 RepID=A0A1Y2H422_9FUNG|nr:hypothetical protein BCR44DRAFT_1452696 [Catenaria anguillulae PL171]
MAHGKVVQLRCVICWDGLAVTVSSSFVFVSLVRSSIDFSARLCVINIFAVPIQPGEPIIITSKYVYCVHKTRDERPVASSKHDSATKHTLHLLLQLLRKIPDFKHTPSLLAP